MKLNNIVNTYLNQISDEIKKEDNMNILRLRVINPIIKEIIELQNCLRHYLIFQY